MVVIPMAGSESCAHPARRRPGYTDVDTVQLEGVLALLHTLQGGLAKDKLGMNELGCHPIASQASRVQTTTAYPDSKSFPLSTRLYRYLVTQTRVRRREQEQKEEATASPGMPRR